jgi:hypothetical protein
MKETTDDAEVSPNGTGLELVQRTKVGPQLLDLDAPDVDSPKESL